MRTSPGVYELPRAPVKPPIKRSHSAPGYSASSSSGSGSIYRHVARRDDEKQAASELAASAYEELAAVYAQIAAAREEVGTVSQSCVQTRPR